MNINYTTIEASSSAYSSPLQNLNIRLSTTPTKDKLDENIIKTQDATIITPIDLGLNFQLEALVNQCVELEKSLMEGRDKIATIQYKKKY